MREILGSLSEANVQRAQGKETDVKTNVVMMMMRRRRMKVINGKSRAIFEIFSVI